MDTVARLRKCSDLLISFHTEYVVSEIVWDSSSHTQALIPEAQHPEGPELQAGSPGR